MSERTLLRIEQIRRDGATQPRASIDFETVFDYMDAMVDGAEFPPVTIFYDGTSYWLADGFHRVKAAEQADFEEISCEVYQGTQQDAQWYSFAANKTNGLRRTNDDKQRAVKAALAHPSGAGLSDRQISSHVGVDHKTVSAWRERLEGTGEIPHSARRKGLDGRTTSVEGNRRRRTSNASQREQEGHTQEQRELACPVEPADIVDGALPQIKDSNHEAREECCDRIYRACVEIETCGLTAKELAVAIRRSSRTDRFTEQLEKTNEFIAAVLAEAVVD